MADPSNAADSAGFGAVAQSYRIAETEATKAPYVELLNAVAADDTQGLYNALMSITQAGSPGSFSYAAIEGLGQLHGCRPPQLRPG